MSMKRKVVYSVILISVISAVGLIVFRSMNTPKVRSTPTEQKAFDTHVVLKSVKAVADGCEIQVGVPRCSKDGIEISLGDTKLLGQPSRSGWGIGQDDNTTELKSLFDMKNTPELVTVMQEVSLDRHNKMMTMQFPNLRVGGKPFSRKLKTGKLSVQRVSINKPVDTAEWNIVYFHGMIEPGEPCIAVEVDTDIPEDYVPITSDAFLISDKGASHEVMQEWRSKSGPTRIAARGVRPDMTLMERLRWFMNPEAGEEAWLKRIQSGENDTLRTKRLYLFPAMKPTPDYVSFIMPVKLPAEEYDTTWVVFRNVKMSTEKK